MWPSRHQPQHPAAPSAQSYQGAAGVVADATGVLSRDSFNAASVARTVYV